jgi:dUTP pyrophosphatase
VFSIPDGYSIRIHPRSGLSLKSGIQLSNCEGVIDSDYTLETFISIINGADIPFKVSHGDRIAQAELVRDTRAVFTEVFEKPTKDSNRTGGFGSTGLGAIQK